jgi:hypothetical protein
MTKNHIVIVFLHRLIRADEQVEIGEGTVDLGDGAVIAGPAVCRLKLLQDFPDGPRVAKCVLSAPSTLKPSAALLEVA